MVTFRSSHGCSRSQGISLALSNLSHLWPRHAQSTWHEAQSGSRCIIPEKVCEFETIYIRSMKMSGYMIAIVFESLVLIDPSSFALYIYIYKKSLIYTAVLTQAWLHWLHQFFLAGLPRPSVA